jgi:hypothetical protein
MNTEKNNINNIPTDILYTIKKREYKKYNKEIFKLHLKFLKNIY